MILFIANNYEVYSRDTLLYNHTLRPTHDINNSPKVYVYITSACARNFIEKNKLGLHKQVDVFYNAATKYTDNER